jgi:hypothetical protein
VLGTAGDVDYWTFDVAVRGSYVVSLTLSGETSVRHRHLTPTGATRSSGTSRGGTSRLTTTLSPGRHVFVLEAADGRSTTKTPYRLTVTPLSSGTAIAGEPTAGTPVLRGADVSLASAFRLVTTASDETSLIVSPRTRSLRPGTPQSVMPSLATFSALATGPWPGRP